MKLPKPKYYPYYILCVIALVVLFFLWSSSADARDYATNITNNYYSQDNGNDGDDDYKKSVAAAFAMAGAQFDYSKGWQGAVSAGYWDDESAIGAQLAKRVDDILISGGGACDTDFDQCGGLIAASWHF